MKKQCVLVGRTKREGDKIAREITEFARELNTVLIEDCKRQIARNGSIPTDFVVL